MWQTWDRGFTAMDAMLPAKLKVGASGDKLHNLASILVAANPDIIYAGLMSHWKQSEKVVIGSSELNTVLSDRNLWASLPDFTERMIFSHQRSRKNES
ncbi:MULTISPECIES: hypothetical protein [unclassified Nostoc]|uniref:hypothetical protein n=1 Tax=unclassified Nostoc TaxID=2593658 RepID=UPI00261DA3AD|nr:hypothetical protein [Nostoc sp. S13]MDF5737283.1 hypothetical protein [Nostoc sp. S13]